jgi:hypothetical protein
MTEREKTNGVGENSFLVLLLPPQMPSELAFYQMQAFVNSNNCTLVTFLLYNKKVSI